MKLEKELIKRVDGEPSWKTVNIIIAKKSVGCPVLSKEIRVKHCKCGEVKSTPKDDWCGNCYAMELRGYTLEVGSQRAYFNIASKPQKK